MTIRNLRGRDIKQFTNEQFRRLGIGKKGQDNGVMLLATVEDQKIWIEVGYGLEELLPDGKAGELWRREVAPPLSRKQYGAGLYAGAVAIAQNIDLTFTPPAQTPASSGAASSETLPEESLRVPPVSPSSGTPEIPDYAAPTYSPGVGIVGTLLGLVALMFPLLLFAGIIWAALAAMRRPLRCSKCRAPVQQLSDSAELPMLSEVQQFEQQIGARDYRVWRCEKCQNQDITAHDLPFSQWTQCPTCRHQTASTLVETVRDATPWQGGLERVILSCQWPECKHASFYNRLTSPLPRGYDRGYGGSYGGGNDLLTGVVLGSILNGSMGGGASGGYSGGDSGGFDSGASSGNFDSGPSDFGGGDSGGGGAGGDY